MSTETLEPASTPADPPAAPAPSGATPASTATPAGTGSGLLESLHRTGALVTYNALMRLRDPSQLISYLVAPMVFMVMFQPLYTRALDYGDVQAVTGQLMMFSVFAMSIVANAIFVEREWRTWDRLRASRAGRAELLVGKAIPVFVVLLIQQSVLIVFGWLVVGMHFPRSVGLLALAMGVWGFALLGIGSLLATIVRSRADLFVACDVGALVISAIGGALLPVDLMPGWARHITPFSPGTWGLKMLRSAVEGNVAGTLRPALVCLAFGLVAGTVATYRLAHGWGRSHLV